MNLRLSPVAALRATLHVTSQVAGTFCQIRSHVWHMSVHCSPIAACTARYRLLGLPHSDVSIQYVQSSAQLQCLLSSCWIIQSIDQSIQHQLLFQEIALPPKSPKSDIASACPLAAATGARQKRVSSRESAMYTNKGLVLPRPLARFFAGGEGENSGLLCYASDPPVEPQKPPRAVPFPLLGGTAAASKRCCKYRNARSKRLAVAVSGAARCARCLADAL